MPLIQVIHSSSSSANDDESPDELTPPAQPTARSSNAASSSPPPSSSVKHEDDDEEEEEEEAIQVAVIVRQAIQALVEHYQQPIHLLVSKKQALPPYFDSLLGNCAPGDIPPVVQHWLTRLQEQVSGSSSHYHHVMVVQSLVESYVTSIRPTLFHNNNGVNDDETIIKTITPPQGVPVLTHYELLLSQFLCRIDNEEAAATATTTASINQEKGSSSSRRCNGTTCSNNTAITIFARTLHCMACDITRLTACCGSASSESDDDNNNDSNNNKDSASSSTVHSYLIPNVILPTLIRLLQQIQSYVVKVHIKPASLPGATDTVNEQREQHQEQQFDDSDDILACAIRRCDVSVLAFGLPSLGPLQIHSDLRNRVETTRVLQDYAVYPLQQQHSMTSTSTDTAFVPSLDYYLSTSIVVQSNTSGSTSWEDPIEGIATRSALAYWKSKTTISSSASSSCPSSSVGTSNHDDNKATSSSSNNCVRDAQKLYFRRQSCVSMAKAVRAHFFGRDMTVPTTTARTLVTTTTNKNSTSISARHEEGLQTYQQQSQQQQQQQRLHLGRWTRQPPSTATTIQNEPFRAIPSRLHVACQFVSLLTIEDNVGDDVFLQELLPIVMALLSASVYSMQAWGAACLLKVLSLDTRKDFWTRNPVQANNLLSLLNTSIQTCREGPVLAVLGMAQQELLRLAFLDPASANAKRQCQERRKATQEWLLILSKNLHSSSSSNDNQLVWGVLAGGIVPLFYDHCKLEDDGSLMELGRLGLLSLLPLVRDGGPSSSILDDYNMDDEITDMDRIATLPSDMNREKRKAERQDVQLLALLALSNLMVAAHPIMPHHGGKIMCALLSACYNSCPGRDCHKDVGARRSSGRLVFDWACHVAAMAVVGCGERAADILDLTLQESSKPNGDNDRMLVIAAQEIKRRADEMMASVLAK